ncbi:hypothetical protein PG987_013833 [Apiospora arundinis]
MQARKTKGKSKAIATVLLDDDEERQPVRQLQRQAPVGPPIRQDAKLAPSDDVHSALVEEFQIEAIHLAEKIQNSKQIRLPIFSAQQLRGMALGWTTDWYETGPRTIMEGFLAFKDSSGLADGQPVLPGRNFTVLLKREGSHNIFHTFHEMMSLMHSIDILRLATDPMAGRPYVSKADVANTQIVVLDDHPDGPFWDLWRIWSVFVRRILDFYGIAQDAPFEPASGNQDDQLALTFVDRRQTRRLEDQDGLLDRVRMEHPGVKMEAVDFGSIPLRDQINVARNTDILVGVHGAGLTHSLFMKEGRGALVEIFPPDFQYSGLRAIARERNLHYYKTHNTTRKQEADWHFEDVRLDPETFSTLIRHAVYSLYNRPGWSKDLD